MNVSVLQIITYLYENYGDIEPGNHAEDNKRFTAPYKVSTPIKTLWEHIKKAIAFAGVADAPYTVQQVNNNIYDLLRWTGKFKEELKEWRQLPIAQQTWPQYKHTMTRAHSDLRWQSTTTAVYNTANNGEYGE